MISYKKYEKEVILMLPSEIIRNKLNELENNTATIRQLNGGLTNFYLLDKDNFWSDNLNRLIGEGYPLTLFDILEKESIRFIDGKIPKGNARANKLGDKGCDMDTVSGIFGYLVLDRRTGESIHDPVHVFAAILAWAKIAENHRGYIKFNR